MLLVDNEPVSADSLAQHPTLRAAAERFLAAASAPLPPHRKLIYVCQGEEATCAADEDALLCSSDATTCLIAALVTAAPSGNGPAAAAGVAATAAGAAAAAGHAPIARIVHHDEVSTRSLAALQHTVAGLGSAAAQLWLVGAYDDSRGTGAKVARYLLNFLEQCQAAIQVQLCCTGPLNTTADGSPRATALALDLQSLAACAAAPACDQRGPLLPARISQWIYSLGSSPSTSAGNADGSNGGNCGGSSTHSPLRSVYCAASRRTRLVLRQGQPLAHVLWQVAHLAQLPDGQLLQQWSTSPLHEPPHFCQDMRASFRWLLAQSGPVLSTTQYFTWTPGVGWQQQAEADAAAAAAAAESVQGQLSLV